jgi:DNA-binding response OmpR family regulator
MTDRILVVEDDSDVAQLIVLNMEELGFEVDHFDSGEQGLEQAVSHDYALLILDVMLPKISGLDICRKVRDVRPEQAIIMLTAKSSETDRVLGLELGADDYITKPFSVRELQARVRSQMRKVKVLAQAAKENDVDENKPLVVGKLVIDQKTHQVLLDGELLELTATEFELLHHLASHPNQVFTRAQLLEAVWGYHHSGYEHTVNSHINRLRAKVEPDAANPQLVQTVWGVGYKFNPQNA